MDRPVISVILPVYNTEKFLTKSIESILVQTYKNFELIIINDGSTDNSLKIIKAFKDERIKVVSRDNRGLAVSLNEAIKMSSGKYLARQDADDISMPRRLEIQVKYLDTHLDVGLLGSNYHIINGQGKVQSTTNVFTHPDDLRLAEFVSNQFGHGAVMLRKSMLDIVGNYDNSFLVAQDYDLWTRMARKVKIANLAEPLYMWRNVGEGLSTVVKNQESLLTEERTIRLRELRFFMSRKSDYKMFSTHPLTTLGGTKKYFEKKSTLFKDLGLLYLYAGYRRYALLCFCVAVTYAPWIKKTYSQLTMLYKAETAGQIPYDYI